MSKRLKTKRETATKSRLTDFGIEAVSIWKHRENGYRAKRSSILSNAFLVDTVAMVERQRRNIPAKKAVLHLLIFSIRRSG